MLTVNEILNSEVEANGVDIITIHCKEKSYQYDSKESVPSTLLSSNSIDYEVEFDSDEGIVYLDICCE